MAKEANLLLHLGSGFLVKASDLVAIISVETFELEKLNLSKPDKIIKIGKITKSVIITNDAVYYSPISSQTLKKRIKNIKDLK